MKKTPFLLAFLLFSNFLKAQIPTSVPLFGLLAYYAFDSNANDVTGNGFNGTLIGDATFGTDRFGIPNHCYVGDGNSAINIDSNDFPVNNASCSVSAFFKATLPYAGGDRQIMGWGGNTILGDRFGLLIKDTAVGFEGNQVGVQSPIVHDSSWHNLTITYPDSGQGSYSLKVYIDGVITHYYRSLDSMNTLVVEPNGFIHYIGAVLITGGYDASFVGSLDDIGVWNRELTACEVKQIYTGITADTPAIVQHHDTLKATTGYSSYQWELNGTAISGATNGTYIYADTGNYTVIVTDGSGCSGSKTMDLHNLAVNNVIKELNSFTITPNPASGQVIITSGIQQAYTLKLINEAGQTIKSFTGSRQKETIDVSNLPSGVYDAILNSSQNQLFNSKLVIKH